MPKKRGGLVGNNTRQGQEIDGNAIKRFSLLSGRGGKQATNVWTHNEGPLNETRKETKGVRPTKNVDGQPLVRKKEKTLERP